MKHIRLNNAVILTWIHGFSPERPKSLGFVHTPRCNITHRLWPQQQKSGQINKLTHQQLPFDQTTSSSWQALQAHCLPTPQGRELWTIRSCSSVQENIIIIYNSLDHNDGDYRKREEATRETTSRRDFNVINGPEEKCSRHFRGSLCLQTVRVHSSRPRQGCLKWLEHATEHTRINTQMG